MAKYNGMEVILKNPSTDLLSCAISSGNKDLALFLIENNFFSTPKLSELVTHLTNGAVNKNNIAFLSYLEKKWMN